MKDTMEKTALKLTKSQLQTVLNDHILQENGIFALVGVFLQQAFPVTPRIV